MITIYLLGILFVWYAVERWKKRHLFRLAETLKSSLMNLPLIGHGYILMGDKKAIMKGVETIGRDAIKSGGIVAHWLANKLFITVADADVADIILKGSLEKDDVTKFFAEVTGEASIYCSVDKWRSRRKLLAPTFNMQRLKHYVHVFAAKSAILTENMTGLAGQGPVAMWKMLSAYSMDSVCETTMGFQVKAQDKMQAHPILSVMDTMWNLAVKRICSPWLHPEFVYKLTSMHQTVLKNKSSLYSFMDDIIKEKRQKYLETKDSSKSESEDKIKPFVELVIESDAAIDDVTIREESLVLLGAGTDTSAVGLGFTFVMIARHPDVQEKVYQELKTVFGESTRLVEADDLPNLKYLEMVIKESLRLYPPAPILLRKTEKNIELPSKVIIPPNVAMLINVWAIQRNPAHWGEDADEFCPERFLESQKHPAAFIPFSFGPRNCAGYQYAMMSMKTLLATVLRKYSLSPGNQRLLRLEFGVMMRDVDEYSVCIEKR